MGSFPNIVAKDQFGDVLNLFVTGGSQVLGCNFIVDRANGNGLGIRSLKGSSQVSAVYMNTSASPAVGNPNPLVGYIAVEFNIPFSGYVSGNFGYVAVLSGTPINVSSGLSLGQPYVIVSLGTTTPAQWQALGFPTNQVPAVGASFVATTASAGSGTGVVETPATTSRGEVNVIGDPNQTSNPATGGAQLLLQVVNSSGLYTLPDGTVVGLTFIYLSSNAVPII